MTEPETLSQFINAVKEAKECDSRRNETDSFILTVNPNSPVTSTNGSPICSNEVDKTSERKRKLSIDSQMRLVCSPGKKIKRPRSKENSPLHIPSHSEQEQGEWVYMYYIFTSLHLYPPRQLP